MTQKTIQFNFNQLHKESDRESKRKSVYVCLCGLFLHIYILQRYILPTILHYIIIHEF